jgi:hypothetical protein
MSHSATATHAMPAAIITHTVASIRGQQDGDIAVYHARTTDVRIAITWGAILMTVYTAHAAQGLLEAFAAARAKMAEVPRLIPPPPTTPEQPVARHALAIDWTRRPAYAVVAQSATSKLGANTVHWVDLHTGPITWQIRDQVGLRSALQLLTHVHRTAIAVCLDGEQYRADPTGDDYTFAA